MLLLEKRIKRILDELKEYIYPLAKSVEGYSYKTAGERKFEAADPGGPGWETFGTGSIWGGHREYHWFTAEIAIPEAYDGKCVIYELTTGREGSWEATNPQFRIYVNGKMVQGLDVNHRSIILAENAAAGDKYTIVLLAFTGDNNFHLQLNSRIAILDPKTEKLYYDMAAIYEAAVLLNKDERPYIDMIRCLNDTVNLLDLRIPFSTGFYTSVDEAGEYLNAEFYEKRCGQSEAEVWCVGHTHIDVAWLWTLSVTKDKALRSFATVLELMKRYPDYVFMSSQAQLYKYVKEQSPELYDEIRKRVEEGRWEPEGSMFVEADCNIASGESLVRQIVFGKRFFKEEFNAENKILWLPDVFGYSAALPQILQKSGIPYFMTTKISWNDTNKLPHDTFKWRGIDGSEVLVHFIPTTDYKPEPDGFFTTYNGRINASQVKGAWQRYQDKDLNNKVLLSFGYGDGGGGPTGEMLENHKRLSKGIPGCPKTVMATSRQYFDTLQSEVDQERLPKWSGELYLEFHRGTYTSMARNKKFNRRSEFMYQNAELFSVLAAELTGSEYPQKQINDAWEVILRNQFHDILPGSSIKEVYDESKLEYEGILTSGEKLIEAKLSRIAANIGCDGESVIVFNPNGFLCSDVVAFKLPENHKNLVAIDKDAEGNEIELACQITECGTAVFFARNVPSKGYKTFKLREAVNRLEADMDISANGFSNAFFDAGLDDKGNFVSIYDKSACRQVLKPGGKANAITAYEDKPMEYDAWNIEMFYREKSWAVDDVQDIKVAENGPVRGCLQIRRKFLDSTIVQSIYIYNDIPRIDIKNNIDWKEKQILLRAAFPVDVHVEEATYEIQYGNVKRPTHFNTSWDAAKFEVCTHKWADISEDDYGISLLNDCKYGYDIHDGVMGISMLKSAVEPNPEADKELHEFVYSLYPHQGGWKAAGTVHSAYALNNRMTAVVKAASKGSLPQSYSLVSCDAGNVMLEVVKKAEDSDNLIIRMYEYFNRRTKATVTCSRRIAGVSECDLLENGIKDLKAEDKSFTFEILPYEIKTFAIKCNT